MTQYIQNRKIRIPEAAEQPHFLGEGVFREERDKEQMGGAAAPSPTHRG